MRDIITPFKKSGFAKNYIFNSELKFLRHPVVSLEPYEFYNTCIVAKKYNKSFHILFAKNFHALHNSPQLCVRQIITQFAYSLEARAVNMSEWVVRNKIAVNKNAK